MLPLGRGAVQFYIGLDGLNVWLIMLTAALTLPQSCNRMLVPTA